MTTYRIYDAQGCKEGQATAIGHEDALVAWALEDLTHGDDRLVQIDDPYKLSLTWYRVERSLDNIRVHEVAE